MSHANTRRIGDADYRLKGREGERGDRTPVIFVGRAMVRAFDDKVVVSDGPAVAEIRERMTVGIYQREINIGDAYVVYSLLVQEEFGLEQHGDFLLCRMGSVQRDFEAITSRVANRRFPHKLKRHDKFHTAVVYFFTLQPLR